MTGMPRAMPPPRTAFAMSYGAPSIWLPPIPVPGRATVVVLDATCSRDTPSAWCTYCAAMTSRSSPWLTADVGLATGGPDSDRPSNFRMQPPALRAAADPEH